MHIAAFCRLVGPGLFSQAISLLQSSCPVAGLGVFGSLTFKDFCLFLAFFSCLSSLE